ncbi:pilin [Chromobacterium subtsugae]|uniref:pilin n=1 Tax=Chromobacterium subtsugae TaxID=251747 RepID=UPI000640BE33|nr:pilin [Chromobacterium subtsugae]
MQNFNEAEREQLYRAAIGPQRQEYYLARFLRFDSQGKPGAGWHWPNLFITFFWLLYRKQWLPALIYYLLPGLFLLAIGLLSALAGAKASGFLSLLYLAFMAGMLLLPPLCADAFYYRRCQAKIRLSAQKAGPNLDARLAWLAKSGGVSRIAPAIAIVMAALFGAGLLAATAIPAYQNYAIRAQVADALSANQGYQEAIGRYYSQRRALPSTLADSGYTAGAQPESVRAAAYDKQSGALTLSMSLPRNKINTLVLAPVPDAQGRIRWVCSSTLPDAALPDACRRPDAAR